MGSHTELLRGQWARLRKGESDVGPEEDENWLGFGPRKLLG